MSFRCYMSSDEVKKVLQGDPHQFNYSPYRLKLDWGGDPVNLRHYQESFKKPVYIDCNDRIQLKVQYEPLLDMFMIVENKKLESEDKHAKMRFLVSC